MSEQRIREKFWEQVTKEFDDFKKEQLKKSKEDIFNNAYEIAILSEFLLMCDPVYSHLSLEEVKTLMKEKYPVHTLYNFYMKTDDGGIGELYESIWYQLSLLHEKNNKNQQLKNNSNLER